MVLLSVPEDFLLIPTRYLHSSLPGEAVGFVFKILFCAHPSHPYIRTDRQVVLNRQCDK